MKRERKNVLKILNIISISLIVIGFAALISLFFSKTFPLWRIIIAIGPIAAGIILKRIVRATYNTIAITKDIIQTAEDLSEKNQD